MAIAAIRIRAIGKCTISHPDETVDSSIPDTIEYQLGNNRGEIQVSGVDMKTTALANGSGL
jgi:hypothetical protein